MNVFAFELEVKNAAGAPVTVYVATKAFETGPADTPANTLFREVVKDPGGVSLRVFGSGRTAGLVQPTWGSSEFTNVKPGASSFDAWVDFNANGGRVTCRFGPVGGAYPDDFKMVFRAYVDGRPQVNGQRMQLNYRGRETLFDAPVVTEGFDGTGGIEGTGAAAGRLRRLVIGRPGFIEPILIDEVENVWFVADNAPADWGDLENGSDPPLYTPHDGGIPLQANGLHASLSDLFTQPTPNVPGQYMHWAGADGEGPVLVKLASGIVFQHRYPFDGAIVDDPGVSAPRAWTIVDLALRAGITDAATMATGSTAFEAGNRVIETETFREVFNAIATAKLASIGFNQVDEFTARPIMPATGSVFEFVEGINSRRWDFAAPSGLERRVWQVKVSAGVTSRGALAKAAADDVRDQLVRDQYLYRFTASSQDVLDADSSAISIDVVIPGNDVPDEAAMLAWADGFLGVHGAKPYFLSLEADFDRHPELLDLRLLDAVTATSSRYGTRVPWIIGIDQNLKSRKLAFQLMGLSDIPTDVTIERSDAEVGSGGGGAGTGATGTGVSEPPERVQYSFALTDPNDIVAIPTGVNLAGGWLSPFDWTITPADFVIDLATPQTSGSTFTADILIGGVSIFSTKPTIDNGEASSITSATPPVFSEITIERGDRVHFRVHQQGTGARGLTFHLSGVRT
jgi:hypothetical protein